MKTNDEVYAEAKRLSEERAEQEYRKRQDKVQREDTRRVIDKEAEILSKAEDGPLGRFLEDLELLFKMVKAYWNKEYTEVPWKTIAAVVAALLYVLNPVDLIPDFIPMVGLVDDAAVVGICLRSIDADLQTFKAWHTARA